MVKTVDEGFKNNKKRKEKILEHNNFYLVAWIAVSTIILKTIISYL